MNLKLLLPTEILLDTQITRIIAEAEDGSFCLLPRHVDFVAALVPGIVSFTLVNEQEQFAAIAEGILVKTGQEVHISTRKAVLGQDLALLEKTVAEQFMLLDDREKQTREATAKLEADFFRRFVEFGERHHA